MAEFILIFIAIVILFSVFRRYILFFIMRAVSKRLFDQVQKQHGRNMQQEKPEGSVTIDTTTNSRNRKNDNNEGEYVNYEEVK